MVWAMPERFNQKQLNSTTIHTDYNTHKSSLTLFSDAFFLLHKLCGQHPRLFTER